jgi:serine O-acetyltransferase
MYSLILLLSGILKKDIIAADLYRYFGKVDHSSFRKALKIPGFEFMLYFRLSNLYSKFSVLGAIGRIMNKRLTFKYGFQIPRATAMGKGLRISHFGALVVNYNAIIGENCYLSHNVTIGQIPVGIKTGSPRIGNRVWIGPGAVLVGNIQVGDDVLVAPNSFVNMDVPERSIVIGNPAKIIRKDNPTDGYITHVCQ